MNAACFLILCPCFLSVFEVYVGNIVSHIFKPMTSMFAVCSSS